MQSVLFRDLCRGFRRNVQMIHYVRIGCFRRNAHYVSREMLDATNNPGCIKHTYVLQAVDTAFFYGYSARNG